MNPTFISYGTTSDICLPPGNKTCVDNIALGFVYNYYSRNFTYVKICIDGHVSLNGSTSSDTLFGLLEANISTLDSGTVCYRSINDSTTLSLVSQLVISLFGANGYFQFSATNAFVATWNTVPFENTTVSFQIVLVTDDLFSFLIFLFGNGTSTSSSFSRIINSVSVISLFNGSSNQMVLRKVHGKGS